MSGDPSAMLVTGGALVVLGGALAVFPNNPVLQVKDFGKRLGGVKANTRSLGIVLILFGLMFFGMVLFVKL